MVSLFNGLFPPQYHMMPHCLYRLSWFSAFFAASLFLAAPAFAESPRPTQAHAETAIATVHLLSRYHYQAPPLDNALSSQIFDRYLKALDPARLFFLQSDINDFSWARTTLDKAILEGRLETPFLIFDRYSGRVKKMRGIIQELLSSTFDFTTDENFEPDRSEAPWAASDSELREIWRKRIKNDWLRLRLAGNDNNAIQRTLLKRYGHALDRSVKLSNDDVFQVFMNAWAGALEPHTNYLGPRAAEDFAISMKLSLVGIGAVLQERDDYVIVRELIPGGPAQRSGKVNVGDRIVSIAQGENAPMIDVTGWRTDEVVPLIRGKHNSIVVLDILPAEAMPDGAHRRVSLVRDTVRLENQAASGSIREIRDNGQLRKIGIIKLPSFYQDTDARRKSPAQFRSATRDVTRIIGEFKRDKIDALLIDLRDNAGGSLDEAISLTGLFINSGPVVIQQNSRGQTRVERINTSGTTWEGPLGVLINRASASASEIFAAAIQDYGRGIVIGADSFGKGTVQTLIDLDELERAPQRRYGELKMTIAQFFRISGGTTQLRGVTPDIALPSFIDPKSFGESSYDNALPWTRINPVEFRSAGNIASMVPTLALLHKQRVAQDKDFLQFQEKVTELKTLREQKIISLKESSRRAERDRMEIRAKMRGKKSIEPSGSGSEDMNEDEVGDDGLLASERSLSNELAAEKARKTARDVLLTESANILGDMVDLLRANSSSEIVQREKPLNP
ncbi:MAG: carboxy terminal-processing peptidase [Betaproteobacteria bacterium]|nr:carboxy terminal-processing peptidase [Betaproteobacteria bacterium]